MKRITILIIGLVLSTPVIAQVRKVRVQELPPKMEIESVQIDKQALKYTFRRIQIQNKHWYSFNSLGLNMSEVAFSNWNAGGVNSISILTDAKFRRRYTQTRFFWDNELLLNYGVNIQQGEQLRKTDDQIVLNSTFGYRTNSFSDWYYSAKVSFLSQFSNGYNYPNREMPISQFMAPGYLIIGLGAEYAPQKSDFNLFLSPLTLKSTFVLNQDLADKGAFGVKGAEYDASGNLIRHGKKVNSEVGILVSGNWNTQVYENIMMTNRFSFYTQYNKNFGNIDIDWEMTINMKVNDHVQARLGTHLKYDDDVKFKEAIAPNGQKYTYGARVQFKQILGVGVSYKF